MCVCVCVCSCMNTVPASSTLAGFSCSSHWPGCECTFCEGAQMPVGKNKVVHTQPFKILGSFWGQFLKADFYTQQGCIYLILCWRCSKKEMKGRDMWPSMVSHTWNLCSKFHPSKCTHTAQSSEQTKQLCCGARGAVGGSVPCSRVSPQSWYYLLFLPVPRLEPATFGLRIQLSNIIGHDCPSNIAKTVIL